MKMKNYSKFFLASTIWAIVSGQGGPVIDSDGHVDLHGAIVRMMWMCRQGIDTIFIYDEQENPFIDLLYYLDRPFVAISYKNTDINHHNRVQPTTKIDAFVLFANSIDHMERVLNFILDIFEPTHLDNIGPFYIIDRSKPNCDEYFAWAILTHLLDHEVSDLYFICYAMNGKEIVVLTLNPFSTERLQAPDQWMLLEESPDSKVTMIFRGYDEDICEDLYFDRMKFLNGHTIKIATPIWNRLMSRDSSLYNEKTLDRAVHPAGKRYIESLVIATKIKINFTLFDVSDDSSVYRLLESCSVDLLLLRHLDEIQQDCYETLYPTTFQQFNFVTQSKGIKTPLERIRDYYGIWTLLSMIVLLSLTFIVIWVIKKDWSFAGFEVLRLLINSSIQIEINNASRKIFFSMIFLYFLVFQATFSGHLAEFLTQPEVRNNPETIDDLNDPQYTELLSTHEPALYLETHKIADKIVFTHASSTCMKKVLHSKSTVCIGKDEELMLWIVIFNSEHNKVPLHKPKETFGFAYTSFYIRRNSPLKSHFENILLRAKETGYFDRYVNDNFGTFQTAEKMIKALQITGFRLISLQDLTFAFIILGAGLFLATIVFIAEICIDRFRKFKEKKSTQVRNFHSAVVHSKRPR